MEFQEKFMKEALKEARKAYNKLEIPVGAVIVKDGQIIARAHNQKETKCDTTGTMDEKTGAVGSVFNIFNDYKFNHKVDFETGILKDECEDIIKSFFKELRKIKKVGGK